MPPLRDRGHAVDLGPDTGAAGPCFAAQLSHRADERGAAQASFWGYAALMGLSLASILLIYTGTSIARVFFISAATFAAMSLYGYTTRRDLSQLGSILFMGLIGVVLASLVNIFIASSALQFTLSVIGVIVFTGLTAWDTQRIKEIYLDSDSGDVLTKKALMGALALYLDFINPFVMMLQLASRLAQRHAAKRGA